MDDEITSGFGVNLIAYIRAEMGLGTAARGIAHALQSASVPFNILNFEHANPSLHRDESWMHKETTSSSYEFTLLAVNPDNLSNARTRVQKKCVKDRYTIGYWFWELPEIPDDWQASFSLVDEVWAGSRFIQDAISLRSSVPVFRVPVPVRAATSTNHFSRQDFSLPEDRFLFLSMSDTHSHLARKNPLGAISAFKKAFSREDKRVGLVLKLSNVNTRDADQETIELIRDEIDGYENIYLLESDLMRSQVEGLLATSNCFLSLHRSEGFGLGPAEAMSLGKPVILTRWSGNTDYMTPTNSIGIDYRLVPVGKQLGPYKPDQLWADPDLDQAAFWMQRLVEDPGLAEKTGRLGQETIAAEFSPEAVGKVIHKRLSYLRQAGFGRHLHKTKAEDSNEAAQLLFFASREGSADVRHSHSTEVVPGQWCRLKVDLPWGLGDGTAPFRFDPIDRVGLVDLAAVVLRSSVSRDVLWRASTRGGLEKLTVGGTALRLPHERLLRFLSYGDDPQVYLPHLTGEIYEEPLTLELLLRFDPAPKNIERAMSGWNEQIVALKRGEAAADAPAAVSEVSTLPPPAELSDESINMVVYSAGESGYSEERSTHVTYARNRWSHLDIALQLGLGSKPLRLDPVTNVGLIDVAALTIRSAIDDEVLWRANGGGELNTLQVSGSAVRIPHPTLVRVLSYGSDPQIFLPAFPGGKFDGPLRLEVWLKTDTGLESIRKGISELASMSSQAAAATSQTQGLLEQSNRAFSEKETELEALRVELQEVARGREEAIARAKRIEEAAQQEKAALEEKVKLAEEAIQQKKAALEEKVKHLEQATQQEKAALAEKVELAEKAAQQQKAALEEEVRLLRGQLDEADKQAALVRSKVASQITELEKARRESAITAVKLERSNAELDKARREAKAQRAETKRQVKHNEILAHDYASLNSRAERIQQELTLFKEQLVVEHEAKLRLIEEFSRAGEKIRSLKQDLVILREAALEKPGNGFRKYLGLAPETKPRPVPASQTPQDPPPHRFWIDFPNGPVPEAEKVYFSGWVLGPPGEKVLAVRALVNGESFVGRYGFERGDVASTFSDRPEAAHPGFSIAIPLPAGTNEVVLQALNSSGKWTTFCVQAQEVVADDSVEEPSAPEAGSHVVASGENAYEGALEEPAVEATVEHGLLLIKGWLHFDSKEVAELVARFNGEKEVKLAHSLRRPDVAGYFANFSGAAESGFEGYATLGSDYSGPLKVEVEALLTDGNRITCFKRDVITKLPQVPAPPSPPAELSHKERYAQWVDTNKLTPCLLKKMKEDGEKLARTGPKISVIVPTYNTPKAFLRELLEALQNQLYPNWQLCIADDASTEPHVRAILERAAATDPRVSVVFREKNGHIVQASNSALSLAQGDYAGLLDHDDLLSADALLHVAEAIVANPDVDLLYTDEDKLSPTGERYDPIFKGSFSPEMALTHNYIQHFTVIRKKLLDEAGGFREGFEGAQDLDLYLRVLEKTTPQRVRHIPFVCYHWRSHPESTALSGSQKGYVFESARKSITEALQRRAIRAAPFLPEWADASNCCLYQLKWAPELLKENPVTIIIPTKDRVSLLEKCLASLERTVEKAHVKVLIVDDFSEEKATHAFYKGLETNQRLNYRVIQPRRRSTEFNFSALINEGVAAADTPLVLLLNNDTEALEPGWLEEMAGWMSIDGVGAVGAKLLYPDGTIQHAGVIVGPHGGLADHIFHRLPKEVIGFNFLTHAARNVSGVTGACLLTSKSVFEAVGGFDQDALGMEYNDVDFCLRLGQAQKRVVFTPQATLVHYCGQSRGPTWRPAEHASFLSRYPDIKDPFYNENLDLERPMAVNPNHFLHGNRMGSLKVLMISHNLNLEGAPKVLFDQATYFRSMGAYDVTVLSRQDGPLRQEMEEAGIEVRIVQNALPMGGENRLTYMERLRKLGDELDVAAFDLVVCNTLISFWGVALAGLCRVPVIWHIHESTAPDRFFHFDHIPEGLVESCLGSADRVVFEAKATRQIFESYERKNNFTTIAGSIDVAAIDAYCERHSPESLKSKHGIDPTRLVVNLIGTTCARKGQLVFVQAIELLQKKRPDLIAHICFIMLGARESAYLNLLRERMEAIRESDTRLLDETHDVFEYYRLSDVLVCASFQESFPRVILEGMAFKLPIVTTDVFGIPEMVNHQGEGLFFKPGDYAQLAQYIEDLSHSLEVRRQLGARAHANVTRRFNSAKQLERHLALTKEVVARHA